MILDILLLPRGSGNRNKARALAAAAKSSALRPHITRAIVGTSRVTLHLRSSLDLLTILADWPTDHDVPGQLLLPGLDLVPGLAN